MKIKLFLISLIVIILGIAGIILSYIVSSQVIYSTHIEKSLGDFSSTSINLPQSYNVMRITGKVNGSINLYLINYVGNEIILGKNINGSISIVTTDRDYNTLFILNNNYPSNFTLDIEIYNSSLATNGYIISSIVLGFGFILMMYSIFFRKQKISNKIKIKHKSK
ncbi:hypothetical protein DFR86_04475 [Acidianus sulfidivorans JP7]|uniref:Uncharacterized protein n=1 Tax=Acidianus sulfidivorans JP7 TaxID=619593 RepID=A0A2U9ILU5_9CREN|nr:hypothetical protein [Acidianus sulfidivorans]AWR96884.1 hypothetical protein DFR86_04475 [Acidianus sulfidivorans JP7]